MYYPWNERMSETIKSLAELGKSCLTTLYREIVLQEGKNVSEVTCFRGKEVNL